MRDWSKEEIQFIKEYFSDYPTKEIALEINRPTKQIIQKAKELGLLEDIPAGYKKCKDCNKTKPLEDFYKHSSSKFDPENNRRNIYCKACDNIRRRNNSILKKLRTQIDLVLEKENLAERLKIDTENIYFECTCCGKRKIGQEFYFDSHKLKRFSNCIECYLKKRKDKELKKIIERGY